MITQKIGLIGCGNMGGAILSGALESGVLPKENAYVYDVSSAAMERAAQWGVNLAKDCVDLCQKSDIILLAVKPQYTPETLAKCQDALNGKAIVSIVAGITAERLRAMISGTPRILRTMPNTPAMVFEGAFALCSDNDLTEEEQKAAIALFEAIGIVELVPEHLIDAVCGLSGGGPAYVAMFIEAMADGGVKQGLPRATAYRLAAQTCLGTAKMILEKNIHPGHRRLRSPGAGRHARRSDRLHQRRRREVPEAVENNWGRGIFKNTTSQIENTLSLFDYFPPVCILLMTFSRVNSSRSFSSSALLIVYTRLLYMGIVMFFSALARFWVFLILVARRYAAFSTIDSLIVRSFTSRNASRAISIDSWVVLKEYVRSFCFASYFT